MHIKPTYEESDQKAQELKKEAVERRKAGKGKVLEKSCQTLYEHALAGLYCCRITDGKIIRANQATATILGYDLIEDIVNEFAFAKACSAEKRAKLIEDLKKNGTVYSFEMQVTGKDGKQRDLILTEKIYPEYGYIEGAMIDVTDKKRFEARIQQAQKMEAISTLAGGIAHYFNNLLMGIQGYNSLMLNDLYPTHPHYERLKRIEVQVKRGAQLTSRLLGFARGGKYNVRPTDINEIVKKSIHIFGRTQKKITIKEKYARDLYIAEIDQGQIEQALLDIYVNASQAMSGGGHLYIKTSNVVFDEISAKRYNVRPWQYVMISITDTGIGMDEATLGRIFEPFFTTKGMGRETGLGLASVYGIIKNHGGMIDVYSEKGQGSTFNIYLPAVETPVSAWKSLPIDEEVKRGNETIFLVDDEQVILDVGEEMLTGLGYKVFLASGGNEAIDVYKANKDKIDIVILDIIMPGMGGGETYEVLKKINPDIKTILSSGYNINGKAIEAMAKGANDFIQKPFTMKELSHKIREILSRS